MTVLAHHPLLESLPFFLPMLIVVAGIAVLTLRDRRRHRRGVTAPRGAAGHRGG